MKKELRDDYRILFTSERGKAILEDLESFAPSFREPTVIKHAVDPIGMAIEIGKADVVKYIYKMMKPVPEKKEQKFATTERKV